MTAVAETPRARRDAGARRHEAAGDVGTSVAAALDAVLDTLNDAEVVALAGLGARSPQGALALVAAFARTVPPRGARAGRAGAA